MIVISDDNKKYQQNFWNNCLFHPTDAVEDPWGKRILDKMSNDGAIKTIRIYAMLEDVVYLDENGDLSYDFRLTDLRLDYLTQKGYDLLIAYGMMPECIASNKNLTSCVSKNKTRYKGKLINVSPPSDYALWEEVCFNYTKHLIERYGLDVVSKWHLQCFNEADISMFFMADVPDNEVDKRVSEYIKLYNGFAKGICRASEKLKLGGPALAHNKEFLEKFLKYIKETSTRLDFISLHNYGATGVWQLCNEYRGFNIDKWVNEHIAYLEIIDKCGMSQKEIIIDEWGMAAQGFYNIEECPYFISRENEVFSAYFVKLIATILNRGWNISKLLLCLSGQHEMVIDFSGFRNFFTLNFFAKPIYNAFVLASKLHNYLLTSKCENQNIFVIPTKNEKNEYAVLLTYSNPDFEEDIKEISQEVVIENLPKNQKVIIYCIDKEHTNPYRLYQRKGFTPELSEEDIKLLREEGNIKPKAQFSSNEKIKLNLTANSVFLIVTEVNEEL